MTLAKVSRAWFSLFFLFCLFLSLTFYCRQENSLSFDYQPRPILKKKQATFPENITARSFLVVDALTGTIAKRRNIHWRLAPASLTKIPAALVALKNYPLNQIITVEKEYTVGKTMDLKEGEEISISRLLQGLLIHSANDAAYVLAGQNGKKQQEFVDQMNRLVKKYDLKETHFVNFDGEQDLGHLSSAFDLAQLTRLGLKNPVFKDLVQVTERTIYDQTGRIEHKLETTNDLLAEFENVKGVKTGWTPQAGECLISLVYLNDKPVLLVVLGSEDRFEDSRKLINWSEQSLYWLEPEVEK